MPKPGSPSKSEAFNARRRKIMAAARALILAGNPRPTQRQIAGLAGCKSHLIACLVWRDFGTMNGLYREANGNWPFAGAAEAKSTLPSDAAEVG